MQEPCVTTVEWASSPDVMYRVQIQVEGLDRKGLLSDLIRAISEAGVKHSGCARAHLGDDTYRGGPVRGWSSGTGSCWSTCLNVVRNVDGRVQGVPPDGREALGSVGSLEISFVC